jgi:hypothetical protein
MAISKDLSVFISKFYKSMFETFDLIMHRDHTFKNVTLSRASKITDRKIGRIA